jgi:hypothetical protein
MDQKRRHISRGTQEYCQKMVEFLNRDLTFAEVAEFQAHPYNDALAEPTSIMRDYDPLNPLLWEVTADEARCHQYGTSYLDTMKAVGDWSRGWEMAGKPIRPLSTLEQARVRYLAEEEQGERMMVDVEAKQLHKVVDGFMTLSQCKKVVRFMQTVGQDWQLRNHWEPETNPWYTKQLREQHWKYPTIR